MSHEAADVKAQEYLTFFVQGEEYGIAILRVREIIEVRPITRVPGMPIAIRGVINLRGTVLPVVDLAIRFGLSSTVIGKRTCVVIVEVTYEGESAAMGLLVDAVNQAEELPASSIEPPPTFGTRVQVALLDGLARREERFVLLLNVDRVLDPGELPSLVAKASPQLTLALEAATGLA